MLQGPNQAMLVPDTRGERTRFLIMSDEHYNQTFQRSVLILQASCTLLWLDCLLLRLCMAVNALN